MKPLIYTIIAVAFLALLFTTPLGVLGVWFAGASIASVFEQNHGDPAAPLNRAALSGNWREFELLVKERSNRRQAAFPRLTAKLAAVNGQNILMATLIDKHGFDVNQRVDDRSPRTVIDFAAANNRAASVDLLLARGAKLHTSADIDGESALMTLANVDAIDQQGRRDAIHIARLLIERGQAMRGRRMDGPDPLYAAIKAQFPEMVALLLDSGASPDETTSRIGTPLEYAVSAGCRECEALIKQSISRLQGEKPTRANR